MADRSWEQFGDYRLIRLLGEGTFGEVYLGEHVYLGTRAAVKVLHARLAQEEFQTFLDEARKIAALNHPHIVRVLNFSMQNQTPYLVMQLAAQGTLKDHFPRGKAQPLKTFLPYVKQAAEGLQHAHDNNIIHLDIKPANLLLGERGEVLLADFGIAKALQTQRTHQTVQGFGGTPVYAAPEQFQNKPGMASDQYALAVVVYEWLTGTWPFQGDWFAIGTQKLTQAPPPLRAKVAAIPGKVEAVVLKALSQDPHDRFPGVRSFAKALEEASYTEMALPTMPAVSPGKQEATVVMRGRPRAALGVKVSSKTDPGRRSKENEDNFLAVTGTWKHNGQLQPFSLFVIADGLDNSTDYLVQGKPPQAIPFTNGQDASRIAVESIYQHLVEALPKQDAPDEALGGLLQEAIQRANQMIYQQNQKDHADMGCTMTAALVTGSDAYICNVGDSRTYLLKPNERLQRVTTDHSIVESLVAAGVIQKDDVYTHPKRNQLYRTLGYNKAAEIDVFRQRLAPGDKLLLCSNGLWQMMGDSAIEAILRRDDLSQVTSTLVEMANENGGVDNITAIVVKMMEDARPARQPMIQSVASGPANLDHPQR